MEEITLCSNCFKDEGLKYDAAKIGIESDEKCPQCNTKNGRKLNKDLVILLIRRFFIRGTLHKTYYGAAPLIQYNDYHYKKSDVEFSLWLKKDIKLLEESIKIGFFHYGPRLWMVGEIKPLKLLERKSTRGKIIQRILEEYPNRILSQNEHFYRLRKEPKTPSNFDEYDSPPIILSCNGRLDSMELSVMYGSQDLEVCVHECRVTIDDELYIATLIPTRDLNLLDLTEIVHDDTIEFESLDIALHMLFLAGEHSYEISREIAFAAYKAGYDGLIYPSYFSLARTGAMPFETIYGISIRRITPYVDYAKSQIIPNFAVFGHPIAEGNVTVKCINRLVLNQVLYDINFGPVIQ